MKGIIYHVICVVAIVIVISACGGVSGTGGTGNREYNDMIDLDPPVLEEVRVASETTVEFCFGEEVRIVDDSLQISMPLEIDRYVSSDCGVVLHVSEEMQAGMKYTISFTVSDSNNNSLDIISNVYGYNGHLPDIVINEFTTQGSKSRPDIVELYVKSSGNIGGLTLYEGSMSDWESRKILPAVEVAADSYILIHFRPQGIEAEIDETTSTASSGGISAHDQAWDFWVEEGNGLSGNNGALVLASSPQGVILDAVIYSNRTSSSDDKHRGFGNARNLLRAEEIHAAMAWESAEGDIRPEDAINPENSTATRSMCRGSDSEDTNRKEDWHIVPTSTASFGEKNSDEEHEP